MQSNKPKSESRASTPQVLSAGSKNPANSKSDFDAIFSSPNTTGNTQKTSFDAKPDFDSFFSNQATIPRVAPEVKKAANISPMTTAFSPKTESNSKASSANATTLPKTTSFGEFSDSHGVSTPKPAPQDLDDAFGGPAQTINHANAADLFGAVDFEAAFNTPFPPPASAISKPKLPDRDSPDVQSLLAMGFSYEQSTNALQL